jgi:hypothetical protein
VTDGRGTGGGFLRSPALPLLAALVTARLAFQVFFVPPFEGPDEPFHLSRAAAFADAPWRRAAAGLPLDRTVEAAVRRSPCGPDLRRAFGCPPFGSRRSFASYWRAGPPGDETPQSAFPNHENNQPPLYYAAAGALFSVLGSLASGPLPRLLALRLFSLGCALAAVFGPLRALSARRPPGWRIAGLSLLLLPGASEALVRASNDAPLFLWASLVVLLVDRERFGALALLLPLGPLVKMNALPIAAFALVVLARRRGIAPALAAAAAALAPAVLLGGWRWAGSIVMTRDAGAPPGTLPELAVGLGRSAYTVAKTFVWLGGWSFTRMPVALVVAGAALLAAFAVARDLRLRRPPRRAAAHAAGLAVAAAGTLAFVLAIRRAFGAWGGVGGWYVWPWVPWLALAGEDVAVLRRPLPVWLAAAIALWLAAVNAAWLARSLALYYGLG